MLIMYERRLSLPCVLHDATTKMDMSVRTVTRHIGERVSGGVLMRVLVTGGIGVNGAWVTRKLLERGHEPIVLDNRPDFSLLPDLEGAFDLVLGDVRNLDQIEGVLRTKKIERIAHLAAFFSPDMEQLPFAQFSVSAMGTVTMLEAAARAGIDRFVYTSSRGYYGSTPTDVGAPGYLPISEDFRPDPNNIYNTVKLTCEAMGRQYHRVCGIQFIALRFAGIYGPGKTTRHAHSSLRSRLVEDPFLGLPVRIERGGDQFDDMIYVDDIAEAIVLATLNERVSYDAYNIASGEGHTLREFAAAVRHEIPNADIEIGPGNSYFSGSHSHAIFDIRRAKADLGWAPRYSLAEGVRDYVAILRQRGI
jgi:UDP-glucose 4-epimerase